jgi:hypothetical protein
MQSPTRTLLDANVLYSNHLRNLLLQLAQNDLFDAKWSALIEDEWLRNMEPRTRERIESRTLPLIRTWFSDALVSGFDPARGVGAMDAKDRHVASAAAAISPCVLVTENLRHFDAKALEGLGVTLRSPDDFLCDLFDAKPNVVEAATREAAANLTKSLPTWEEYSDRSPRAAGLRSSRIGSENGRRKRIRAFNPSERPPPSLRATELGIRRIRDRSPRRARRNDRASAWRARPTASVLPTISFDRRFCH